MGRPRGGTVDGGEMFLLLLVVAPLFLLVASILLPVAFVLSFAADRPWTIWGRGVLLALTGLCVACLVGLFTAGGPVMDAGDVCFPALHPLGDSSDHPYPTLRPEHLPFHAICSDGLHSVDLVPGFVNPTLAVCASALLVSTIGAVVSRLRGSADPHASKPDPARPLPWILAGLGPAAMFLTLTGFVPLVLLSPLALLGAIALVLRRRRTGVGRPRR